MIGRVATVTGLHFQVCEAQESTNVTAAATGAVGHLAVWTQPQFFQAGSRHTLLSAARATTATGADEERRFMDSFTPIAMHECHDSSLRQVVAISNSTRHCSFD